MTVKGTTKYTEAICEEALKEIANGENLVSVVKELNDIGEETYSFGGLCDALNERHFERYVRARETRTQRHVASLEELEAKMFKGEIDSSMYREAKDRIKWQSGKENQGLYGDKIDMTSKGEKITIGYLNGEEKY